jgi:hypothetical protein
LHQFQCFLNQHKILAFLYPYKFLWTQYFVSMTHSVPWSLLEVTQMSFWNMVIWEGGGEAESLFCDFETLNVYTFLYIFFGRLECIRHSSAYVAHFVFLRYVWIRTKRAARESRRDTNLANQWSINYLFLCSQPSPCFTVYCYKYYICTKSNYT